MTRDEYRTKCLEAMRIAIASSQYDPTGRREATAAFDSLHGIARVMPIEATKEMLNAAYRFQPDPRGPYYIGVWAAMSSIGDLTNPPEK